MPLEHEDLRRFAILAAYDDQALQQQVMPYVTVVDYPPDAIICRERSTGDRCFFLLRGQVDVRATIASGREESIGLLEAGSIFGQVGLLDGGTRSATCVAISSCRLLELCRDNFDLLRTQNNRFAFDLQIEIGRSLAAQIRQATQSLSAMSEAQVHDPAAISQRLEAFLKGREPEDEQRSQANPRLRLRNIKL